MTESVLGKIVIILGVLVIFVLNLIITKRIKELTYAIKSISVSVSFQKDYVDVIKRTMIHCTDIIEKQAKQAPRYTDEIKTCTSEQIKESIDAVMKELENNNFGRGNS